MTNAKFLQNDLSNTDDVRLLAEHLGTEHSDARFLVNNPGIFVPKRFVETQQVVLAGLIECCLDNRLNMAINHLFDLQLVQET